MIETNKNLDRYVQAHASATKRLREADEAAHFARAAMTMANEEVRAAQDSYEEAKRALLNYLESDRSAKPNEGGGLT